MTEENEENIGPSGTSRRDFLRKSAIAGGMVWAAPTVMSLGPSAFALEGIGGSPGGAGSGCGPDDLGTRYRFKWDTNGVFESEANVSWKPCFKPSEWDDAVNVEISENKLSAWLVENPADEIKVRSGGDDDPTNSVIVDLPFGCSYEVIEVKAGNDQCNGVVITPNNGNEFTVQLVDGGGNVLSKPAISHIGVVFCCSPEELAT